MAKITRDDVWRVASEIDAGGDKPTVLEVRKRLGAGSYTTITAALREWVKPEADNVPEIEPMPADVADRIEQFGAELYAIVARIAAEKFEAERQEYEQRIKVIQAERDEAVQLADVTDAALEQASGRIEELQRALSQAVADSKLWESRVGDLTLDKERALLDAATARQDAGVLRGRLDVYEAREVKPSRKKQAPGKSVSADEEQVQAKI